MNYKWKYYLKQLKKYLKNLFCAKDRIKRDDNYILNGYGNLWENPFASLKLIDPTENSNLWLLNGKPVVSSHLQYLKEIIHTINAEIKDCESILELGAGIGLNLIILAILRPEIKIIQGVELTSAGVEGMERLLSDPSIKELSMITGYSRETILAALKKRDIKLLQGDIRNLPFEENTFDCVFSRQAIEQLNNDYTKVCSEAFRVTKRMGIFVEQFREVQNIFNFIFLKNMDYFRSSYKYLEYAGFSIKKVRKLNLNKIKYNVAIVVAGK